MFKYIFLVCTVLFFIACGQNHHITSDSSSNTPAPTGNLSVTIDVINPAGSLVIGDTISITGSCTNDGNPITITNSDPTKLTPTTLNCICGNAGPGQYSCGNYTVVDFLDTDLTSTAEVTDSAGGSAMADASLVSCITEELNHLGGTLAHGTTYTTAGTTTFNAFTSGGNWVFGAGQGTNGRLLVNFTEPVRSMVAPITITTTNPWVWHRSNSTFPNGTAYCPDAAAAAVDFVPVGTPRVIVNSAQNCVEGTSAPGVPYPAQTNWGTITSDNTSSFHFDVTATDAYKFSAMTCGENTCPLTPPTTFTNKSTFSYTGSDQFFDTSALPASTCWVKVKAWGAGGGSGFDVNNSAHPDLGGGGGFTSGVFRLADLPSNLLVVVGEGGYGAVDAVNAGTTTYGNGGASGVSTIGAGNSHGAAGGGLSGVFDALSFAATTQLDAFLIAGGGGGSGVGGNIGSNAGAGGGLVGQTSRNNATGGTQTAGGIARLNGDDGAALLGGAGAGSPAHDQAGGGGGGGYFGGGGGGSSGPTGDQSGGGGSGFVHASLATSGVTTAGNYADVANSTDPDYAPGVGIGGVNDFDPGGNGRIVIEWE